MAEISKEEFLEWCHNPVTKQLYLELQDKINNETWSLVDNAGVSTYTDARSSGRIMATGEILNWKPETLIENVDEVIVVSEEDEQGPEDEE